MTWQELSIFFPLSVFFCDGWTEFDKIDEIFHLRAVDNLRP